jgi:hypothetical protein
MKALLTVAFAVAAIPALAQTPAPAPSLGPARPSAQPNHYSAPFREDGPVRTVWSARKSPETPYGKVNKPIWHIADVLKAHKGQARWEQQVLLSRDFNGRYVQMAAGDKSKCMFWADDRAWGWVYSGQVKVTIDGQEPKVLPKGWVFNVAPRPVLLPGNGRYRAGGLLHHHAGGPGAVLSGKRNARTRLKAISMRRPASPRPAAMTSSTCPFFNVDEYGASTRTGRALPL